MAWAKSMTTQIADDLEERLQCQLRRISRLEADITALSEVNDILRKALTYYVPLCAALAERETLPSVN